MRALLPLLGLMLASCSLTAAQQEGAGGGRPVWHDGQTLLQGYFGVSDYRKVRVDAIGAPDVESDDAQLPLIGGGAQLKLGGGRLDAGLEGMISFTSRADIAAFAASGSGAVVAVDVDLLLVDLYGGPFLSVFLGDRLRVYAATGPLMEWASYGQSGNGADDEGTGFGTGAYARGGLEWVLGPDVMLGFGLRWSDSTVDLGQMGDMELDGVQYMVTLSRGL